MFRRVEAATRRRNGGRRLLLGVLAAAGLLVAGLAESGVASASKPKPTATPTFAAACGKAPVTLQGYFESGFPDITDLTAAFTKQYPTAKWSVREDPLLIFDGDWESGTFDTNMSGKVGFFLMPPLKAGGPQAAMSAPLTYGIAANAAHASCAALASVAITAAKRAASASVA